MGMFDGNRLVSFVLNGIRVYNGLFTAYDIGTGTIKVYRGKGLTTQLLAEAESLAKSKGVEQYLLEVLCNNAPAVALYEKRGFLTSRVFLCHQQSMLQVHLPEEKPTNVAIEETDISEIIEVYPSFCDVAPSWQNNNQSLLAAHNELIGFRAQVGSDTVGCIIGNLQQGDVSAIAVAPGMRRAGISAKLLRALVSNNHSEIVKVLNIDESCISLPEFLDRCKIPQSVKQFEMIKRP